MAETIIKKINKALDEVKPQLQADGGDLQYVNFDQKTGVLKIELMGHCAHCPMSAITLKEGIEKEVKKAVKEVKKVIAV
jgi:Fe-S cluster biogenesis protein NfuA